MADDQPRLYTDLASWFHLLTAPADYVDEAALYYGCIVAAADRPPKTLLELGSGGGNLASNYKQHVAATLVDLSQGMLDLSRGLNPDCEHVQGDMRTVRLGRTFDAVLVHDGVVYMTSEADLRAAMATAFAHCRPGGVAIFVPDWLRETFIPTTDHGGHDSDGRALRYLEWAYDPDPSDTIYLTDYAYMLHEDGQPTRCVYDRHVEGLFGRAEWLRLLAEVGFRATAQRHEHPDTPTGAIEVFVALRPDS